MGCGYGDLLNQLGLDFPLASMFGVDFSPEVIQRNMGEFSKAEFNVLDIQQDRLDRNFELVVCSEVIEHLDDQAKAVSNLASMVGEKGYLLISCPTGRIYPTEKRWGHVHHPTISELEHLFKANGLRVIEYYLWGFPFYCSLKWLTNINPEWSLKNFASGSYSFSNKLISNALYLINHLNSYRNNAGCQLVVLGERI